MLNMGTLQTVKPEMKSYEREYNDTVIHNENSYSNHQYDKQNSVVTGRKHAWSASYVNLKDLF